MNAIMDIAKQNNFAAVRLVQEAQNYISLSLYIKVGFDINDQATVLEGHITKPYSGPIQVRRLTEKDAEECDALHKKVVGVSRLASIREDAHPSNPPIFAAILETGEIVGFGTGISLISYVVTKTGYEDAIYALHSAFSKAFPDDVPLLKVVGRLYPSLTRRCLSEWGLKTQRNLTLMSFGKYVPPSPSEGIYVPSISY
eukprot:Phypoly_transcript_18964.p1 GENE.Phypoly_transcript_18964~~Phypoly_transcript_18964.p1  ORF type:complete len:199 (+),score=27.69 Phypoly_transcript_18964:130-726(+)